MLVRVLLGEVGPDERVRLIAAGRRGCLISRPVPLRIRFDADNVPGATFARAMGEERARLGGP